MRLLCMAGGMVLVLLALSMPAFSQVQISEIMAAPSERMLQWDAEGKPKLGVGIGWVEPAFNDAAWPTGPAPIGSGDGAIATVADLPAAGARSMYLRKTFTLSSGDLASSLPVELRMLYDDGFVAYLNGVELTREALGATNGFVFHDQPAFWNDESASLRDKTFTMPASVSDALVAGENVLAVQVHNIDVAFHHVDVAGLTDRVYFDAALGRQGSAPWVNLGDTWSYFIGTMEPSGGYGDPDGFWDWIELRNTSGTTVHLGGWALTDDMTNRDKWIFPDYALLPGQYLLVFASGLDLATPPFHTNFKLERQGEYLGLFNSVGNVVDQFSGGYPYQTHFQSYGRDSGGSDVYFATPTPGAANSGATYLGITDAPVFDTATGVYATPFDLNVSAEAGATVRYFLYQPGPASSDDPVSWEFDTDGDLEGWGVANSTGNMVAVGGDMRFDIIGQDPFIHGPSIGLNAAQNGFVTIRMKTEETGLAQLFFATQAEGWHSEPKSIVWNVETAGEYVDYVLDMAFTKTEGTWTGVITNLRLDALAHATTGTVWVDYIRIGPEGMTGPPDPPDPDPEPATVAGRAPTADTGTVHDGLPIAVDKNTVVRAIAVKPGYLPSPVVTESYIFGIGWGGDESAAFTSIPVVSFVGDEERELYEPFGGMAVNSDGYGHWWRDTPITPEEYNLFVMHGRAYERPFHMAWIDPAAGLAEKIDTGFRMGRADVGRPGLQRTDGHWLNGNTRYVFRTYFRDEYGGGPWEVSLFDPDASENKFSVLAFRSNAGDWVNPAITDEMMRRLTIKAGMRGSAGTFVNLFVNGEFKTYLNPCERLDEDYFKIAFDSGYDWDVLKQQVTKDFIGVLELKAGTYDAWDSLIQFVEGNNLNDYANWLEVERRMDVQQFVDWLLVSIYCNIVDWPWNNWVCARERSPQGKFRFYAWDCDSAFQTVVRAIDRIQQQNVDVNRLYRALRTSNEFTLLWQDRVQEHFNYDGALVEDNVLAVHEELRGLMAPVIGYLLGQTYNNYIETDWIPTRRASMFAEMDEYGYTPVLEAPAYIQAMDMVYLENPNLTGTIYYTLDGRDPRQRVVTDSASSGGPGTFWAHVPTADIGTAWRGGAAFDHSAWRSGTVGVGYERGSGYAGLFDIDVNADLYGITDNCYVRAPFNVDAADLGTHMSMTLNIRYDDAFVAYLNGVEIYRAGFNGEPTWNTVSDETNTTPHEASSVFDSFDVTPYLNLLQAGENILAVHALNYAAGGSHMSSDFLISAHMTLEQGQADPRFIGESAVVYDGPVAKTPSMPLMARVLDGTTWSPLLLVKPSGSEPGLDALRITEFMYHPADGGAEFLEIMNTGATAINVGNVRFCDGVDFTFPPNTVLAPGERILLIENAAEFEAAYPGVPYLGVYAGRLDNGGERISICAPSAAELFSVTYNDAGDWPSSADGQGFSLVLIDPDLDPNDPANWRVSSSPGGSPGTDENPLNIPAVLITEALTHTDLPQVDSIEIHNPTSGPADVRGWYLTDNRMLPVKARIPDDPAYIIPAGGYAVVDETVFSQNPGEVNGTPLTGFLISSHGEEVYLFSADLATGALTGYSHGESFGAAENGVSFGRYVDSEGDIQFVAQSALTLGAPNAGPKVGPVVISEIHYHPPTGGVEYVELTNISDQDVALWDNSPGGDPANAYTVEGIGFAFKTGTVLPAGAAALIVNADPEPYHTPFGPFGNAVFDGTASLDNGGEALELQWPDAPDLDVVPYIRMDRVKYNDVAPWPAEADGMGMALRRVDLHAFGNEPANWTAVVPTYTDDPVAADSKAAVWLRFGFEGTELGTEANPYSDLDTALLACAPGGTLRIYTAEAADAPRLTEAMRVEARNGLVRLGVPGAAPLTAKADTASTPGMADLLSALGSALADADAGNANGATPADATGAAGVVYAPVLPYETTDEGHQAATPDSVLAIRLRSEGDIDPDSVWGPIPGYSAEEASAEWAPAGGDTLRDLWVVFRPEDQWYVDDLIDLTVSARTVEGAPVGPVRYQFLVQSSEPSLAPLWQPRPGEDFAADGLDLTAESSDMAVVHESAAEAAEPLDSGVTPPFAIGPQRVYETPQRVWLPLPAGMDPSDIALYYYHPHGPGRGWYPAESVAGWLVPGSELQLEINGTAYYGFLVRHAGLVQIGRAAP